MSKKPRISIITVVYNGEQVLEPTIKSVLAQTYQNVEYVVVDGFSKDGTGKLLSRYRDHIHILVSEPDKGVYDAMNKGLRLATGTYVLFLNAGDELASPTLLMEIISESPDADILYGETLILNESRKVLGTRTELTSRKLPARLTKEDFLQGQVVSHQSFMVRKSIAKPYNLAYSCSADIEWMLAAIESAQTIHNVGQPISRYLQGGISDRNLLKCWKERFVILLDHFSWSRVIWQHVKFALRFIRIGAYRKV